jgi:hypothetical protein
MEFGQFLWSLLIIFFMIMYFMILFSVITDLFRRHNTSGWVKALWIIALLVVPFISLLIYVIIYGQSMGQRQLAAAESARSETNEYIRSVAGTSPSEQIAQAHALLDAGAISAEEFDKIKTKALS